MSKHTCKRRKLHWRYLTMLVLLSAIGLLAHRPLIALAQSGATSDGTPAWSMTLRPQAIVNSELGKTMWEQMTKLHPDLPAQRKALRETLGIDPLNDVESITIFATEFGPQEIAMVADLGSSSGNIEGAMLAAPGYDSYTHGDLIVHITPMGPRPPRGGHAHDDRPEPPPHADRKAYTAVVPFGEKQYALVSSFSSDKTEQLIAQVKAGQFSFVPQGEADDQMLSVTLMQAPPKFTHRGPHGHLLAMITGGGLSISGNEQVTIAATLDVTDEARARQMQQLAQGGIAFLGMVANEQQHVRPLVEIIGKTAVTADGKRVSMSLTASAESISHALAVAAEHEHKKGEARRDQFELMQRHEHMEHEKKREIERRERMEQRREQEQREALEQI